MIRLNAYIIFLQDLLENKPTKTPLYDFRKSGRYAYKTVSPPESKVCMHILYEAGILMVLVAQ